MMGCEVSSQRRRDDSMAQLVVLHRVRDYQAWRQVYDDFNPRQQAGGVIAESVYRAKDDPNTVLVLHSFRAMAEVEAFVANPALRERWIPAVRATDDPLGRLLSCILEHV